MSEKILEMIMEVEDNYANNEAMKVQRLLNGIEKIDNKCGDLLYWQIILMFKNTPSAIVFLDRNTIAYKKLRTLGKNEHLHWYKYDANDATKKIAQLFYDALLQRFIREYKRFNINNSMDVYMPFYHLHELLGIVEKNIVLFENIIQLEEIKIAFVENMIEFLSTFDEYNPMGINNTSSAWNTNQQKVFNRAVSVRLNEFCRSINYLKFTNYTFRLNFDFAKENVSLDNSFLALILKCIDWLLSLFSFMRGKNISVAQEIFDQYSRTMKQKQHEVDTDALITDEYMQEAISILIDEDLIDVLSEIRMNKEKLNKVYESKEKYEMFILTRVDAYIEPFLKYIKKTDGKLEDENIRRMCEVFRKINAIIVNKINELEKKNKENYTVEFNVIENEVERYIKENNID